MYYTTSYASPLGDILLASTTTHLVGLWLEGQKYFMGTVEGSLIEKEEIPVLQETKAWLDAYFAGEQPAIEALALAPIGTGFRQEVWRILRHIPYGEVTTYGAIAKEVARRMGRASMSSQAVGGAVGHNPISIIIPCHRVIGTDGSQIGRAHV